MTFTFDNFEPYWFNKYEVSFVDFPGLIKYVDKLRSQEDIDSIYMPSGIMAKYVAFNPKDYSLKFDPCNAPEEFQGNWSFTDVYSNNGISWAKADEI
jgi:hypothetical protein